MASTLQLACALPEETDVPFAQPDPVHLPGLRNDLKILHNWASS